MIRFATCMLILTSFLMTGAFGQPVEMTFKSTGALDTLRFYEAQTLTLSPVRPESVKKMPEGVTSAEFGLLKLGPVEKQTTFTVVLIGGDTH
ncbi:MAG: hypothetical protein H7210_00010, partial [Pyrinomonadaceae bacterium]|nr:hypothetical protein [Phycisphaerales bacterium]